jgi:AraC-like DNA-binding protein
MTSSAGTGADAVRHNFDAHSLVLCLNLSGRGRLHSGRSSSNPVDPGVAILSLAPGRGSFLERLRGDRHQSVVLEMRRDWTRRWTSQDAEALRPIVRKFLESGMARTCFESQPLRGPLSQIAADVGRPPAPAARACWHHAKALEMIAHAFFMPSESELFCERTKRVGRERVRRVREILHADLENPPGLSELGQRVGCSPFYLSRIFRQETGMTISAHLRQARLQRAAELLRGGDVNVTEAAMAVGYSSLSHFSKAFAEAFGCCPCLYGRKPVAAGFQASLPAPVTRGAA